MTHEEFERVIENIRPYYPWKHEVNYLLDHDQQQRDEIARLRAALDWSGLRIDNPTLNWALKELGPTDTNAEAYVKAAVEHVIYMRDKAHAALKEGA